MSVTIYFRFQNESCICGDFVSIKQHFNANVRRFICERKVELTYGQFQQGILEKIHKINTIPHWVKEIFVHYYDGVEKIINLGANYNETAEPVYQYFIQKGYFNNSGDYDSRRLYQIVIG